VRPASHFIAYEWSKPSIYCHLIYHCFHYYPHCFFVNSFADVLCTCVFAWCVPCVQSFAYSVTAILMVCILLSCVQWSSTYYLTNSVNLLMITWLTPWLTSSVFWSCDSWVHLFPSFCQLRVYAFTWTALFNGRPLQTVCRTKKKANVHCVSNSGPSNATAWQPCYTICCWDHTTLVAAQA
jgi:hypothetical protein